MSKFISNFGDDNEVTDEIYLARLRFWRNNELSDTDWTQLSDAPVDKDDWAEYRQGLRDLPSSNTDPRKIVLPNKPA
jgi:hypothetical protein